MRISLVCGLCGLFFSGGFLVAEDAGADIVLKQIETSAQDRKQDQSSPDAGKALREDLRTFRDLFLALAKRFPLKPDEEPDFDREAATGAAIVGLLKAAREGEAQSLALQSAENAARRGHCLDEFLGEWKLREAASDGLGAECFTLLGQLLSLHPELPAWQDYAAAARFANRLEPAIERMRAALAHPEIGGKVKSALHDALAQSLLASDHIAEGVSLLRESALSPPPPGAGGDDTEKFRDRLQQLANLADLSLQIGDSKTTGEALDALAKGLESQLAGEFQPAGRDAEALGLNSKGKALIGAFSEVASSLTMDREFDLTGAGADLASLFVQAGRGAEIERLLSAWLVKAAASASVQMPRRLPPNGAPTLVGATKAGLNLIAFYDLTGREQDIVTLFDRGRFWPGTDLAALIGRVPLGDGLPPKNANFGIHAARALAFCGRPAAASRTLNAFLDFHGNSSAAYALLGDLLPPAVAEARLEELFARDCLNGRPMITRGEILLGQGRLDEAESSVRRGLDDVPWDDDPEAVRAHGWKILAEVFARKGDAAAVSARRRAEALAQLPQAGRMLKAGLLSWAVAAYQKAREVFGDDYEIEWNLAQALTEMGRFDEAEIRYRHACELIPTDLGRRNQRWLDSDHISALPRMRAAAESVLAPLAAQDRPPNARVHYALGLLRSARNWSASQRDRTLQALRIERAMDPEWKDGPRSETPTDELFTPAATVMSNPVIAATAQLLGAQTSAATATFDEDVNSFFHRGWEY